MTPHNGQGKACLLLRVNAKTSYLQLVIMEIWYFCSVHSVYAGSILESEHAYVVECHYNTVQFISIRITSTYGTAMTAAECKSDHYDDVIMAPMASQITSLTIVYSTVYSGADQRKHQSSASLAFVWGIHRGPVNSQHKWPVTRKMFPFDDVIMFQTLSRHPILHPHRWAMWCL